MVVLVLRGKNFRIMNREYIELWLDKYKVVDYVINEDLSVDINGDVDLDGYELREIGVKFRVVSGDFNCYNNKLDTLRGCPERVGGSFHCTNNILTSLEYCPKYIGGDFFCYNNNLELLIHGPVTVGGIFDCADNQLISLEGCLDKVLGDFDCANNLLESFEYCPLVVGDFSGQFNKLAEDEIFLYDCTSEQIRQYYSGKNLNKRLVGMLSEEVVANEKKVVMGKKI